MIMKNCFSSKPQSEGGVTQNCQHKSGVEKTLVEG